jgi:two-component system response regulator FixJ
MTDKNLTVFIVDDDRAVRDSLADLVDSVGLRAETFANAKEFLTHEPTERCGCLVLDIRMPGMSGLELQEELARRGTTLPVIFITGHGDIPMAVQAMRLGAQDFIQKPFREQELLDRINLALETSSRERDIQLERQVVKNQISDLTRRELEVMNMIVAGKANKVIALDLCLSQRTVEVHRANVMDKLHVRSLADLVRVVTRIGLT